MNRFVKSAKTFSLLLLPAVLALSACGKSNSAPNPNVGPAETGPLTATYASIREKIFVGHNCLGCHADDKRAGQKVPMDTWEDLFKGDDIIVAGQADKSALIEALTRTDDKRMPPKGPYLSDADVSVIKDWINAGAPK